MASRVLLNGNWSNYPHFNPNSAFTAYFYHDRALSFRRYGRRGVTPFLGSGDFRLSALFQYGLLTLYAYWRAGCICLLAGMFGWWLSHLAWVTATGGLFVSLVMGLALISTTFYANLFCNQNYNVIGWAFFPLGAFGLLTGNFVVAAFGWFAVSVGSFTAATIGIMLSGVISAFTLNPVALLSAVPAGIKLASHLLPAALDGCLLPTLFNRAKGVGIDQRKAQYRRPKKGMFGIGLWEAYELMLVAQFVVVHFALQGSIPIMTMTALGILLMNGTFLRFADYQSLQMTILSTTVAETMVTGNVWMLPSLWMAISPLPLLTVFPWHKNVLDVVPRKGPFSVLQLQDCLKEFMSPVRRGARVLMAYDNPKGNYLRLFDGYRSLQEPLHYVATLGEIQLLPDWTLVFELNYQGAPDCWGRDIESCISNIRTWNADYLIIYSVDGTAPGKEWSGQGFELLTSFDWREFDHIRKDVKMSTEGPPPTWWLMKIPHDLQMAASES